VIAFSEVVEGGVIVIFGFLAGIVGHESHSILASQKAGYDGLHALHGAVCVERNPRASAGAVAESVLAVAD
jgi:hypothetical protein